MNQARHPLDSRTAPALKLVSCMTSQKRHSAGRHRHRRQDHGNRSVLSRGGDVEERASAMSNITGSTDHQHAPTCIIAAVGSLSRTCQAGPKAGEVGT